MKQILEITRRELLLLIYSPLGWLILIVFTIHSGFALMDRLDPALLQSVRNGGIATSYTYTFFSHRMGVFYTVIEYLYIYIPFLTMGIVSREFSEGGIRLLLSSPLKIRDIVLGKYLSVIVCAFVMAMVLLLLAVLVRLFVLDSMDWMLLTAGLLIFFCITCLYGAIGLFVSSLTSYQLVAAVGTFAIIFLLDNYLKTLIQQHHPEFIQLIFHQWLPPNNHLESIYGLVNGADIIYYVVLTLFFILLAWLQLETARRSKTWKFKVMIYTFVSVFMLCIGWLVYKPENFFYADFTRNQKFTPTPLQQQVMKKLPEPLTVTRYINVLNDAEAASHRSFFGKNYNARKIRSESRIKLDINYIPYYGYAAYLHDKLHSQRVDTVDAAKVIADPSLRTVAKEDTLDIEKLTREADKNYNWFDKQMLIPMSQVPVLLDVSKEESNSYYVIKSVDKSALLPLYLNNDQVFTTTLKKMLEGPSVIGFLSENGERNPYDKSDSGYSKVFTDFRGELAASTHGFATRQQSPAASPIADSTRIVVIAEPQQPYSTMQMQQIEEYIAAGKSLLITTSPASKSIMEPLLRMMGVSVIKDSLSYKFGKVESSAVIDKKNNKKGFLRQNFVKTRRGPAGILKDSVGENIALPGATALGIKQDTAKLFACRPIVTGEKGDTVVMALTRIVQGREQRIVVAGSSSFLSNAAEGIGYSSAFGTGARNGVLGITLLHWLDHERFPVNIYQQALPEVSERFTITGTSIFKLTILLLLPTMFFLLALTVLLKRKNK